MKKLTFLLVVFVVAVQAFAQKDLSVDSKITNVTVFLNSAQVTREAKSRVESGKTNLIITGLTSDLDPKSIQVKGGGNFIILGISHQQNFLNELNLPKPLKVLKDSIEYLKKQVTLEQSQKKILEKEEQMLLSNQKIGGSNQNLTVAELKAMADFYRSRLGEIVTTNMKLDEQISKKTDRISTLTVQLRSQNELFSRNTSEIVVSVSAQNTTAVDLELNYVVADAGWYPVYDLRATDTKSPIKLNYKASVFQSTGEVWNNVKLKLSTANPNVSGLKPELNAWFLDFYAPIVYQMQRSRAAAGPMKKDMMEMEMAPGMAMPAPVAESVAQYVTTVQTTLNTEFAIALPYTVVSATKPTLVDIQNHEMKADYYYSVTPKLNTDAFLIANATGWEDFNLLPGEANIFFEGTFVGKTFIDPNNVKDTLHVSLGRDSRIVVKREKQKDLTTRKLIGTSQRESYAWQISVRNTKTDFVKIIVEDQIPVSQNAQIEVALLDQGGAKTELYTGKLIWNMTLKPSEAKSVVYKYEVKYPKDKQIAGL
jgi:uncharacterized protein (TIGR02231 family)